MEKDQKLTQIEIFSLTSDGFDGHEETVLGEVILEAIILVLLKSALYIC